MRAPTSDTFNRTVVIIFTNVSWNRGGELGVPSVLSPGHELKGEELYSLLVELHYD
jgi:hypothetical protein